MRTRLPKTKKGLLCSDDERERGCEHLVLSEIMLFLLSLGCASLLTTAGPKTPRSAAPLLSLGTELPPPSPPGAVWAKQAGVMWLAAAALGPLCDGRHSAHDVLHYAQDSIAGPPLLLFAPGTEQLILETCWWVPFAFGGAGVILGAAHPALDVAWGGRRREPAGWPTVAIAVAAFVATYDFSGQLAERAAEIGGAHDWLALDAPLAAIAVVTFLVFERSLGGLFMMFLLFVIGPVAEVGLINQLGLYEYTHADFMGIPSWICWVYAAGGPANGALGRQVLSWLEADATDDFATGR